MLTKPMNEWGFIGRDTFVTLGKSATINIFKIWRGYEQLERLFFLIPFHHS